MAIIPMQKVAIMSLKSLKENVLGLLHEEGMVDISDARESGASIDHSEVRYRKAEVEAAIETLLPFASKEALAGMAKKPTKEEVVMAALHSNLHEVVEQVQAIQRKEQEAKKAMEEAAAGGGADVNEGAYFTGSVPAQTVREASPTAQRAAAQETLESERTLGDAERAKRRLAESLPNLSRAMTYLRWLDEKQAVRETMRETEETVTVFGWIAKSHLPELERKLRQLSKATAVLKVKADDDEIAPVELSNPTFLKPFESVTALYGLPQASEVDPTPLLAPFFILFFGLCLTDAGYGAVLAIAMALMIWIKKITINEGKLWWLLLFSGIFTVAVSIPFGGWFGLDPNTVPEWMTKPNPEGGRLFIGQIWNLGATSGINFFQNLALGLGILHLSVGIFMAGYMKWVGGDKMGAFWVDWSVLVLFSAVGAYFFVSPEQQPTALYAIYATVALVIWGKGHGSSLLLRPVMGLLGLVNLAMSMLSNTLSYLRLLALGLVTGALALAVNLVAQQIGALFPIYVAIPVMIVIYTVGHIGNIALNVLGAFIHSGRLQFVEFFGNFFEGGGRPFKAFSRTVTLS